ncbi:hypothetical protein YB2330_001127 [Saitoella coloradoensis]
MRTRIRSLFSKASAQPWFSDLTYHQIVQAKSAAPLPNSLPPIPGHLPRPWYFKHGKSSPWEVRIPLTSQDSLLESGVKHASRLAAQCLKEASKLVKPGVTTEEIDDFAREWAFANGAVPSSLNYSGFPKSICTSVNNVVAHGIPDKTILKEGSIINLDIALFAAHPSDPNACFHGDTSATFPVGQISPLSSRLLEATKLALDEAITACGPGKRYEEIGLAVERVAEEYGYEINSALCGHGIGREYHQNPLIIHCGRPPFALLCRNLIIKLLSANNKSNDVMLPGVIFTIEPVLCEGGAEFSVWNDNWTIVTDDGGRSAQFEHTIMITEDGVEILTDLGKEDQ